MAVSYGQLGTLARARGDCDEAARQYQRSLDIHERLGNQAGMAAGYGQLGNLEKERDGSMTTAVTWHVKALVIKLSLGIPQAAANLHTLAGYRRELGNGPFSGLLAQAVGDADLTAETIRSLIDRLESAGDSTA